MHFPIDWKRPLSAAKTRCSWDSIPGPICSPRACWPPMTGRPEKIAAAYEQFCREIIDVVARRVPAVKPQAAFFEELGPAGMAALASTVRYAAEQGLLVILDGKRNDIGSTAMAYARGFLGAKAPGAPTP